MAGGADESVHKIGTDSEEEEQDIGEADYYDEDEGSYHDRVSTNEMDRSDRGVEDAAALDDGGELSSGDFARGQGGDVSADMHSPNFLSGI